MTTPTNTPPSGIVGIPEADLDEFTSEITAVGTQVSDATTALQSYITQLLANQATPVEDADETAIKAQITALQNAGSALAAIVPPTTAPPGSTNNQTGGQTNTDNVTPDTPVTPDQDAPASS